jgi:pyruvate/2-oxoglutarate dehydrogenase complex dihydrolipoamide acyltransferase (E2) component
MKNIELVALRSFGRVRRGDSFFASHVEAKALLAMKMAERQTYLTRDMVAAPLLISDAARKRAEELGVDLSRVVGTGHNGRITLKDIENA